MNGRVAKELRREENRIAHQAMGMLSEPLEAVIRNEAITRKRVDGQETGLNILVRQVASLERWRRCGFWERLRWLLRGK